MLREPAAERSLSGGPASGIQTDGLAIDQHAIDEVENCLILHLRGHIGPHNVESFREQTEEVMDTGFLRLILHCAGLQTLSGIAIGAFASLHRKLRLRGGDLVLLQLQPQASELFRLLGFADLVTVATELSDAASSLSTPGQTNTEGIFPQVLACPACDTWLRAAKPGRFRCSSCQVVLAINNGAQAFAA